VERRIAVAVVAVDSLRERSTEAAREYVLAVRARLSMEQSRYGPSASTRRSHQQLERSIGREELARLWPHADLDAVLAP
jgi:hypothetical protein